VAVTPDPTYTATAEWERRRAAAVWDRPSGGAQRAARDRAAPEPGYSGRLGRLASSGFDSRSASLRGPSAGAHV